MIFGKTKLEMKVGIFVFIGLLILIVFVLSIGGFKTWASGYQMTFVFDFVNGVKLGAPVRFAGVDVGEVKNLQFVFDDKENKTKVRILGWIKKDVRIPGDSTIWINTLGLLGEKYVEIMPGKDYATLMRDGEIVVGETPIPMHEVTVMAKKIASDIDTSIERLNNQEGTVGKLLYNDSIYKELEALMIDLRKHPWKLFWKTKE
jgi:phospholipid/cholesterol/gamma-HCH transport system substrate-binding protein